MGRLASRANAKYGIALLITGVVLLILLLNPGQARAISLTVKTVGGGQVDPNVVPAFGLAKPVVIQGQIFLAGGEFRGISNVRLTITKLDGTVPFTPNPFTVELPLPFNPSPFQSLSPVTDSDFAISITNADISHLLPSGAGTLFVDLTRTRIFVNPNIAGANYGYGYLGRFVTGGTIDYTLRYTPPSNSGNYRTKFATVSFKDKEQTIADDDGTKDVTTTWRVPLPAAGTVLSTLHPTGSTEALPGDMVVLQVNQTSPEPDATWKLGSLNFFKRSDFHDALLANWGASSSADFLLPLKVAAGALPGNQSLEISAVNSAGDSEKIAATGASVVAARSKFNVNLMPGFNYISTPLQAGIGTTPSTFTIKTLIEAQNVTSSVPSTFFATLSTAQCPSLDFQSNCRDKIQGGNVFLSDVISSIFSFPGGSSSVSFTAYVPGPAADNLTELAVGRGYIVSTKTAAFKGHTPIPAGFSAPVPQSIPVLFTGEALHAQQVPLTFPVVSQWNLAGLHSESDSTVDRFLAGALVPGRTWVSLFEFRNSLDLKRAAEGSTQADLALDLVLGQFRGLFGGRTGVAEGDRVRVGAAEWLFMSENDTLTSVINP